MLAANGPVEWRKNEPDWRRNNGPRGQEMSEFVKVWHQMHGPGEVTASNLMATADRHDMFAMVRANKTAQAAGTAFGKMLRSYVDAPIAEWFIRWRSGRQAHYWLEPIARGWPPSPKPSHEQIDGIDQEPQL